MDNVAVFFGAHPDDIEIGAGGTVARLTDAGWEVWMVIMTDDVDETLVSLRHREAWAAAQLLGVDEKRVHFLGAKDTRLHDMEPRVIRDFFNDYEIKPDLVFTHSKADQHQDHQAGHEWVVAAVRDVPILTYGVVNHLIPSEFHPKLFVDVEHFWQRKIRSMNAHESQAKQGRIQTDKVVEFATSYAAEAGSAFVEAFEVVIPYSVDPSDTHLISLNDSSFHRFWYPLIGERRLTLIQSNPVQRSRRDFAGKQGRDQDGVNLLTNSFSEHWHNKKNSGAILLVNSIDQENAEEYLNSTDVIVSGGAVSNNITRNHYNHFYGIRYVINYDMPEYRNIRIEDRLTNTYLFAGYGQVVAGRKAVKKDTGILTVMPNPYDATRSLVAVMGIHGSGTLGCYRYLSEPPLIAELLTATSRCDRNKGFQALIEYDVQAELPSLRYDSVHEIGP